MNDKQKIIGKLLVYIGLILLALFIYFKFVSLQNNSANTVSKLQKEILSKDSTIKLTDGKYSKLVDNFKTVSELKNQVQTENKVLYDSIKKRNEKLLSMTSSFEQFKNKKGTFTKLIPTTTDSDTTFTFSSFYPKQENYMAKFTGNINTKTKTVGEIWEFQKMKLGLILTQKDDGLWDYYVDAPDYAIISNVKVNSLPAKDYLPNEDKIKIFGLWAGLGLRTDVSNLGTINNKNLVLKAGVSIKDKFVLIGDASTDKTIGLGFMVKFK
jgi:uncharacterized membrane-anchored protein YhcB (DUF1043 family)